MSCRKQSSPVTSTKIDSPSAATFGSSPKIVGGGFTTIRARARMDDSPSGPQLARIMSRAPGVADRETKTWALILHESATQTESMAIHGPRLRIIPLGTKPLPDMSTVQRVRESVLGAKRSELVGADLLRSIPPPACPFHLRPFIHNHRRPRASSTENSTLTRAFIKV